ncbi:MAG: alpha-L-rhamnosidase C-terminal domain-containing protein [Chthoniobacteraceae bacterium]
MPSPGFLADANARVRHPGDRGAWIWHSAKTPSETAILRFRRTLLLTEPLQAVLHVTADQRFQLTCDGAPLTFGPDRCDLEHWTVQSIEVTFPPGEHTLEALVWHLEAPLGREPMEVTPPMAQVTWRGGFLLFAEGAPGALLNTGQAPWTVEDLTAAVRLAPQNAPGYHDIGPIFDIDLENWNAPHEATLPGIIQPGIEENPHGLRPPGWALYPAELSEQRHEPWAGGTFRAVRSPWSDAPYLPGQTQPAATEAWQPLLQGGALVIPQHSEREALWDLGNYYCGYPSFATSGSPGSTVEWTWAEALYDEKTSSDVSDLSHKGHRGEIEGKVFVGMADRWRSGRQPATAVPALWWRDDAPFIQSMLPGIRSLLAEFEGIAQDGLLRKVPGWPFIDWCPEWPEGCGPGVREGDSSIVNLQWVLALQAAAQLEAAFGDPLLASRGTRLAQAVFAAVESRYWDPGKNLFRDTLLVDAWSEHPQTLALLSGLLDPAKTRACLAALETPGGPLVKATIYGSFYVLRALSLHGQEAALHRRLAWWFDLPERGFTSTPEAPEPSRSDAHAWGAHPAWHAMASIAGIQPAAPGFAQVTVAPLPGPLTWIKASVVHPRGTIDVDLHFANGHPRGTIHLPEATEGDFRWSGLQIHLNPGSNTI